MEKTHIVTLRLTEAALCDILTKGLACARATWSDNYEPVITHTCGADSFRVQSATFSGPLRADWECNVARANGANEPRTVVDFAAIANALARMASGECSSNGSNSRLIFAEIMRDMRANGCTAEPWDCDAVLQCAVFGSIVYG